jgi:hypothetical protein
MDNIKKIVTQFPLANLWTNNENIYAERKKHLIADNIQEILKKFHFEFVIADIGKKLKWLASTNLLVIG